VNVSANVSTGNVFVYNAAYLSTAYTLNGLFWANGVNYTSTLYGNLNVHAIVDGNINSINSNVSAANLAISTINSNVSAANVAISTINSNIIAANLAIISVQSNLTAFGTFANTSFAGSLSNIQSGVNYANASVLSIITTANANTAAYLTTYSGNISAGNVVVTGYFTANNGLVSTHNYYGAYSDGIVVDYVSGNGRISVGTADGVNFYNGGVGSAQIASISSVGNLTVANTITTHYGNTIGTTATYSGNVTVASNLISLGTTVLPKYTKTQLTNGTVANLTAAVAYNITTNLPVYSNGTNWLYFSNNAVI
jgi:hypothetical protein